MDIDELTVAHRGSGTPVYRLTGGAQFHFRCGDGGTPFPHSWDVTARRIEAMLRLDRWLGPIDATPRPMPSTTAPVLDVVLADRHSAEERFSAVTLRAYSTPLPPREQLTLVLPSDGRPPWASLVTGEPPSTFRDRPDDVVEATLRDAALLRPIVGAVGFHLMSEPWMESQYTAHALPFLQRYPGLNLPHRYDWNIDGARVQSVDWLTVLGDELLSPLGGRDRLRTRLADTAERMGAPAPTVLPYDGGVVVRAGAGPQFGDSAGQGAPPSYRVVDAVVRRVRWDGIAHTPSGLLKTARGVDRVDATRRWAARFE
ncbi:type VI immunity family protein [Rhodococcus gannanensis]|uniref:Type VI immunity family protein n=1 Tax=Rhodococcus gannanensis TaxID=1960308 RepID=A0ABW4P3T2_9NOCA